MKDNRKELVKQLHASQAITSELIKKIDEIDSKNIRKELSTFLNTAYLSSNIQSIDALLIMGIDDKNNSKSVYGIRINIFSDMIDVNNIDIKDDDILSFDSHFILYHASIKEALADFGYKKTTLKKFNEIYQKFNERMSIISKKANAVCASKHISK